MLRKDDLELQTEAFLGFAGKPENTGISLRKLFASWARSKDFAARDAEAIWGLVKESGTGR